MKTNCQSHLKYQCVFRVRQIQIKSLIFFFGEEENDNEKSNDLRLPRIDKFLCNFSLLSNTEFFQYLLKRLANNNMKDLALIWRHSDDIYEVLKALESNTEWIKIHFKAFIEKNIDILLEAIKEFQRNKKRTTILFGNKTVVKSILEEFGIQIE